MGERGTVAIVGSGHAGFQVAASLRQAGYPGRIVLVGEEAGLPYHRPPLSKDMLSGAMSPEMLRLRPEAYYAKAAIERRERTRVGAIDRDAGAILTDTGECIAYDHLVLATGARHRRLRVPGSDRGGVLALRTRDEAIALKERLDAARTMVIIGAGFIGLEVAAVARARGIAVTILEAAPRPLARAVSEPLSAALAAAHRRWGSTLHTGASARAFTGNGEAGDVTGVEAADGAHLRADLVLVGIGVEPNVDLAAAAGLPTENGIVVDAHLRTADPAISAIGDCAAHPSRFAAGLRVRVESVQNATDQARLVAARIVAGEDAAAAAYVAVPWFWSDQGSLKVQIAGLTGGHSRTELHGDPDSDSFSVHCFDGDRLLGVESINAPADHMAARRLLEGGSGADQPKDAAPARAKQPGSVGH